MFVLVLNQVLIMCLLLATGFLISKIGLISHEGNKCLSDILLLVVNPVLIFDAFLMDFSRERLLGFLVSMGIAFFVHILAILVSNLVIRKNRQNKNASSVAVERFAVIFSNCGFIGIPLIGAVLGSDGIFYLTPYMVVFNLLVWTYGLGEMTGQLTLRQVRRGLKTPVMFTIILGAIFFLTGLRLPRPVQDAVTSLASLNTPLAMLIAGASLAESNLLQALKKKRLYLVCAVRLLLFPLLLLFIFRFLPVQHDILYVNLIAGACPVATTCTLFALRYNQDYTYSSELFAISTVFSMVTLPLIILISEFVL